MAAVDGLLAMPRIGLGVGGLLLGKRGDRRIEVLRALAIPCSHALGPAFVLTADEVPTAEWQRSEDGSAPGSELASYELVGSYWSKPNGRFELTDYDQVLFGALCPQPWQVALVIRPSLGAVTMAAFGFRGDDNKLVLGVPSELVRKQQEEAKETGTEAPSVVPSVVEPEQPAPEVPRHYPAPAQDVVTGSVIPVAMPETGTLFGVPESTRRIKKKVPRKQSPAPIGKRRWSKVPLALAVLLAILATSAFFTRDAWLPRWRAAVRTYLPDNGISK